MGPGLTATFDLLTTTPNEAAVDVLLAATDAPRAEIRRAALRALIERPSAAGHRKILNRAARSDETLRDALSEGIGFMEPALREALRSPHRQQFFAACQIVLWSREYDLLSAVLGQSPAGDAPASHPFDDLRGKTALQLAELLDAQLHAPPRSGRRRDPAACRGHAAACLERSLGNADRTSGGELVEAYLTLSQRGDAGLRQILHDIHDSRREAVLARLGQSRRPAVMRLLASFIDDPHAPLTAMRLIAARGDAEFVSQLMTRIGDSPTGMAAQNLHRLESLAWASPTQGTLAALAGDDQRRALAAILATSLAPEAKFRALTYMAQVGQPTGRCGALALLADFPGADACQLLLECVTNDNLRVQAAALRQLRPCHVPGAIPLLMDHLRSPHEVVRQAVCDSLSEFRFDRFIASYETLDATARCTTGELVKLIDPTALEKVRADLASPSRLRRLRGLELAEAMNAVEELESELSARLDDPDHLVQTETLRVLANCPATAARATLVQRAAMSAGDNS